MYAKNTGSMALQRAAAEMGFAIQVDVYRQGYKFTLRKPSGSDDRYRKMTTQLDGKKRRTSSVCLHGHYWFFKRLFEIHPLAEVQSTWYGKIVHTKDTLDDNYHNMQGIILRQWDGLCLDDECNCTEDMK